MEAMSVEKAAESLISRGAVVAVLSSRVPSHRSLHISTCEIAVLESADGSMSIP